MKTKSIIVIIVLIISFVGCNAQHEKNKANFPELKGPYLGQKPPGKTSEVFAPGVISRDDYFEHSAAVFSPDLSEVYWAGKPNGARYFRIYSMKMIDGKWGESHVAFSSSNKSFGYPVLSPDGNMLFFCINADIFYVERKGDYWTEPVKISPLINPKNTESERIMSVTDNSSLYFMRWNPNESAFGKKSVIYVSRKINGKYAEPEKLNENINSDDTEEFAIYVARDESYLILESAKDNRSSDLFIYYKMKEGSWSKRINLNLGWVRFPSVSPDGKYLFYMSEGINWVNTSFIEELKPKKLE
ncbi:MAG: hypothetical protein P9M11_04380 [Candidatus Tenebribacter burtonii]|jgi:Tol biopolymer transport system component|nr:hypothetical protein [Candidatus Tenebribacter burtonii]